MPTYNRDSNERIKERIRNLLAVASNDASTDGEIDNAMRFAKQLMLAHHIEESDLKSQDPHEKSAQAEYADFKYQQVKCFSHGAKVASWENYLASFVKQFLGSVGCYIQTATEIKKTDHGTVMFSSSGQPKKTQPIVFFGTEEETELAKELYEELSITIAAMARIRYGSFLKGEGRSYADGFISALHQKLSKAESHLEHHANTETKTLTVRSNQLALRKQKFALRWLESSTDIRLSKRQSHQTRHYSDAYAQGKTDGSNYSVSRKERKPRINP